MSQLTIRVLTGHPAEIAELQQVLEQAPDHFRRVSELPPGSAEACRLVEEFIVARGALRIRIAVVRTNDIVMPFWRRMGFVETGEVKPYREGMVETEVVILEKGVGAGGVQ